MIVFTSALFIGILSNFNEIREFIIIENSRFPVFSEIAYRFFILAILITLVISFIFSIMAFFPKINQKSVERFDRDKKKEHDKSADHNILFFDTNTSFSSSEQLYNYYSEKYKDVASYNRDIANQIYNLSKIAKWKYVYFTKSVNCCKYGFIISVIGTFIVWKIFN